MFFKIIDVMKLRLRHFTLFILKLLLMNFAIIIYNDFILTRLRKIKCQNDLNRKLDLK